MSKHFRELQRQIGQRIRTARLAAGLTQDQLGERIGVVGQQIQKYESGENGITAGRLHLLCHALGTRPDWLLATDLDPKSLEKASQ